jgi:hypothetical protein
LEAVGGDFSRLSSLPKAVETVTAVDRVRISDYDAIKPFYYWLQSDEIIIIIIIQSLEDVDLVRKERLRLYTINDSYTYMSRVA